MEEFDVWSIPYHVVKIGTFSQSKTWKISRLIRSFQSERINATREEGRIQLCSAQASDELYRHSLIVIGWAEEHCQYLDSVMFIDFTHTATLERASPI